jgi:hypothetical protein
MTKEETIQLVVISVVVMTTILGGIYVTSTVRSDDPMQNRRLINEGDKLPTLWIYLNNSEVNSRHWTGFEERSSRVINIPFLNLCYETCVAANGRDYRIEVIGGLSDLAVRLGGWEALPTPLQNPQALVREPELNWIRAAVLKEWGGLWVSPATLWLKPMGPLPDHLVLFGADDEVTFVGPGGTLAPSLRVAWSPIPEHPTWVDWEQKVRTRLEKRAGGAEFRRDHMSDAVDAITDADARQDSIEVRPTAELARKGAAGRRIQIEDLLTAGQDGLLHFDMSSKANYVPIPWPEIQERRAFGWFLRMSEEQILESDLVISTLFKKVLNARS